MRINRGVAYITLALLMSGCGIFGRGHGNRWNTSPLLSAAEGRARFSITKNDNTHLVLKFKNLGLPEELTPPSVSYVVWVRADKRSPAQNIGALKINNDFTGELDAETPLHSFEVFITVESSGQIQKPTGEHLLWTTYRRQ